MRWDRRLWRIARRVEQAYQSVGRFRRTYALPETGWHDARRYLSRLATAEYREWDRAADWARESAAKEMDWIAQRLRDSAATLRSDKPPRPPALRELYEELVAVVDEFDELEYSDSVLSVTTESIVLEGIRLGRFEIRLDLKRLDHDFPYTVVALDPNPAASSDSTTHPHLDSERLCAGDGRAPIAAALADGRLGDFFTVVNRVLHTYAPGSAYVDLQSWHGVPCHACDCTLSEDDTYSCPGCVETLCGDCLVSCNSCSTGSCSNCIDRCRQCDESCCRDCLQACSDCRRKVCDACLEEGLCRDCLEELENETEKESAEPSTAEFAAAPDVEI